MIPSKISEHSKKILPADEARPKSVRTNVFSYKPEPEEDKESPEQECPRVQSDDEHSVSNISLIGRPPSKYDVVINSRHPPAPHVNHTKKSLANVFPSPKKVGPIPAPHSSEKKPGTDFASKLKPVGKKSPYRHS